MEITGDNNSGRFLTLFSFKLMQVGSLSQVLLGLNIGKFSMMSAVTVDKRR